MAEYIFVGKMREGDMAAFTQIFKGLGVLKNLGWSFDDIYNILDQYTEHKVSPTYQEVVEALRERENSYRDVMARLEKAEARREKDLASCNKEWGEINVGLQNRISDLEEKLGYAQKAIDCLSDEHRREHQRRIELEDQFLTNKEAPVVNDTGKVIAIVLNNPGANPAVIAGKVKKVLENEAKRYVQG
ncbi:MAG: hypothetical protein J0I20_35810 [Chloroflexi bacterium]|nr:hypothetical protein [Chloroflexota bacterium]OJV86972.1 MAG: hypothetical protein BGO39_28630 [Chloroflexi bacterium 54-19]